MDNDAVSESERLFSRALADLAEGRSQTALADLERALKLNDNRSWYSYLGYCIAKERGQVKKGGELCGLAIAYEPKEPAHYLNLAKIHLVSGNKGSAIEILRQGVAVGNCPEIESLLNVLGARRSPVCTFLPRTHWVNRCLGLFLSRLRLR